jgi:sulfur-oxidizing protein SoxX
MKIRHNRLGGALLGVLLAGGVSTLTQAADAVAEGREIASDRSRGNCVACHMFTGANSPGDIAPPLVAMTTRYPEKEKLRAQLWDATVANPDSVMPPFGKHEILSADEIEKLIAFLYSL